MIRGGRRKDTTARELKEACRVAAAGLRAQPAKLDRSRWEGCECCQELFQMVLLEFCPACGKPLTEEVRAELERRMSGG